jgi:hypothetical protein
MNRLNEDDKALLLTVMQKSIHADHNNETFVVAQDSLNTVLQNPGLTIEEILEFDIEVILAAARANQLATQPSQLPESDASSKLKVAERLFAHVSS